MSAGEKAGGWRGGEGRQYCSGDISQSSQTGTETDLGRGLLTTLDTGDCQVSSEIFRKNEE